jgi:hypothetical protein
MFDILISRSYVQIKQFPVDEIANIKGSYKNIQKLITDLKSKSFTYNNIVIPNSLILGFITELNLIFKNDMDYILDYYNFCLIYDQQNILLKNKDKTKTHSFSSFDSQLNILNKYYKMDFDELKVHFIIDHLLLFIKYSNAYNTEYSSVIRTILNYFLYYQIENVPFLINKNEIMANLYESDDANFYIWKNPSLFRQGIQIKKQFINFYDLFIEDNFIVIKQDFISK